jgi:hypothetical protein
MADKLVEKLVVMLAAQKVVLTVELMAAKLVEMKVKQSVELWVVMLVDYLAVLKVV